MIKLSLEKSEVPLNESQKLDIWITNLSGAQISNIKCALKFPPQITLLKGSNIIEIPSLNSNQAVKHTVTVLAKTIGKWKINSRSITYRDAFGNGKRIKESGVEVSVVKKVAQPLPPEARVRIRLHENEFSLNEWSQLEGIISNDSPTQIERVELQIGGQVRSKATHYLKSLSPGKQTNFSIAILPTEAGSSVPISIKAIYTDTLGRTKQTGLSGHLRVMNQDQKKVGNIYNMQGAQFAGGFAENVQGNQVGGTINNAAAETPSLAEAAAEIQNLLKQLEASNPTATEADQTAFLNVMIPPTKRERFIGALKAASEAAIDEIPYGPVLKALVEGWQNPS